ncbi:TRAP transporter small permease subunit [Acidihalobacter ferrooxydans]|uniref:TRAP transporter small permease protein n=1 Tax=Acidihalobacter ferrooxydans TaxID=1765967 RepID=A0A1P8UIV3_9GAMM|nr:TRAP transporter small permease [Acidihalobacter ferrooxydans]APZ43760.1 C4-dicarboxylate ABC transporter permease [Acidihalobacter ferrooxydans]
MLAVMNTLRRLNYYVALLAGVAIVGCIMLILVDIVLRKLGISFGGAEEISGYVMAGVASWGASYALTEQAHVRIDFVRLRMRPLPRSMLDLIAILSLATTSVVIASQCWPVLHDSIRFHSAANSSLAIPMWIPQSIWLAGWLWFAFSSSVLALLTIVYLISGDLRQVDKLVGTRTEMEQ